MRSVIFLTNAWGFGACDSMFGQPESPLDHGNEYATIDWFMN